MGFKISTSPKFWTNVSLEMVAEDGRKLSGTIKVQFSRMDRETFQAFVERTRTEKIGAPVLLEVCTTGRAPRTTTGDVSFTPENFKRWCDAVPGSYLAIGRRFFKIHNGPDLLEEREGN
jgi:hypothetical protein